MERIKHNCKHNIIKAFAVLMAAGFTMGAYAVPAKRGVLNVEQPDGSTLKVRLMGDEWNRLYTTEDGYPLLYDQSAGYVYAQLSSDGVMTPTSIKATDIEKRSAETQAFLSTVDKEAVKSAKQSRNNVSPKGIGLFSDADFPVIGQQKALVILVEYQDVKFDDKNSASYKYNTIAPDYTAYDYFHDMLNKQGFSHFGATGSCRDWFLLNSKNESGDSQFIPSFDLYGPVTLSHNMSYYGGNGWGGNDEHPEMMVKEACMALDDVIDFNDYDRNNDGYVDNVYIFYAGYGEADGGGANTVWPHSWNLSSAGTSLTLDGVKIDRYGCSNETDHTSRRPDGIGTFTHEFSHVMGLPDLYATSYTSSFTPGAYSVMDYGPYNNEGRTPPNYSAFERVALDWMTPKTFDYAEGDYTIPPLVDSNVAYMVKCYKNGNVNENEYFLCEARPQTGNDEFIPGHGMLIWHIDYNPGVWDSNRVNNTPSHQYVDLIEANGSQSESGRSGNPFPGTNNVTSYVFKDWAKKECGVEFSNIIEVMDGDNAGTIKLFALNENESGKAPDDPEIPDDPQDPEDPDHPAPYALSGQWNITGKVSLRWHEPPRLEPAGYNIYRNGEVVNQEPVLVKEYIDYVETGTHKYHITAVYEDGKESIASQPLELNVNVLQSGIDSIVGEDAEVIGIYNLQGMRLSEAPAAGVYILRTTKGSFKVKK